MKTPVISTFYGIVVRLLPVGAAGTQLRAFYGGTDLVVSVSPIRVVEGNAPPRVRVMVLSWVRQHQPEIAEAWKRLASGQVPAPIRPLV